MSFPDRFAAAPAGSALSAVFFVNLRVDVLSFCLSEGDLTLSVLLNFYT